MGLIFFCKKNYFQENLILILISISKKKIEIFHFGV